MSKLSSTLFVGHFSGMFFFFKISLGLNFYKNKIVLKVCDFSFVVETHFHHETSSE